MREKRGTWRRRLLIVAIATILLLFLVRAGADLWSSSQVRGVESRLEQRYGSLAERTEAPPPTAPGENRARAIRAAMALIDYPPGVGRGSWAGEAFRFMSLRTAAPVPAELRAFVASNSAALQMADEARARSQSNWETNHTTGNNIPSLLDFRTLSDVVYLAARVHLEEAQVAEAATTTASGLALSASLRQEPSLIVQLIRIGVGQRHFDGVKLLITQTEPSKAALEELARRLAENRTPNPMDVGLLAELRQFNGALRRLEDGELMADGVTADLIPASIARMTGARSSPFWLGPFARLSRPLVRMGRLHYLEQMETLLENQTGARPRAALPESPAYWSPFRWLDTTTLPGLKRAMESSDLFYSQLGLTELAVALRRYRIDRGEYPDALSALVPAYMPAIPMDRGTGGTPEYARQGTGFRLHVEKGKNVSPYQAPTLEWIVPK